MLKVRRGTGSLYCLRRTQARASRGVTLALWERAAGRDQLDQLGNGTGVKDELVAGGLLKLHGQLAQWRGHGTPREDLHFGSLHVGERRHEEAKDQGRDGYG